MVDEDALELLLDPGRGAMHHVDVETRAGIDPFVPRLPERIPDFPAGRRPRRDGVSLRQGQGGGGVDIEIDIGSVIAGASRPRAGHRHGFDLGQFAERGRDTTGQRIGRHNGIGKRHGPYPIPTWGSPPDGSRPG